jgi:hypothetical protein
MFKLLKIGITLIIIIFFSSGCFELDNSNKYDYSEKILGKWYIDDVTEGEDGSVIFNFLSNNSFYINMTELIDGNLTTQTAWMTYNITEDKLIMVIENNEISINYSFSNSFNNLILIEPDGTSTELKRN